jgi:hypothetical protein
MAPVSCLFRHVEDVQVTALRAFRTLPADVAAEALSFS